MPADSRVSHHMSVHSSYPPPPGPGYPNQPSHPIHHHHSSRHASNGPPPPMSVGGPPPPLGASGPPPQAMTMPGAPEATGPPPAAASNGHAHNNANMGLHGLSQAARAGKDKQDTVLSQLSAANENTWMLIGAVSEQMDDQDRALAAFENALRHNPNSILGLNAVASIARSRDNFDKAIEYFQRILNIKQDNGEVWGSMGHCLLMKDDLPKAYTAYQQALHYLPNPKEPKLWYGIGILYDRYGSFEHAEEAFSSVLKMDSNFEKANEIYFRLGIIYKHQRKYANSLDCFRYIINNPPRPLTSWDIWFQLGHVYELDHDYAAARDAYMRVLGHQPDHAKVLQQLGWLYHQPGAPFANQEQAVTYLTKSLEADGSDSQSWYLLGRAFMAGQRYNKAYEAYQQAVYRDGRNPTFWCSIGVLYFQINQYRDALDAYSRAIRLNPYIWEVWYNLGSLYESCNNQITDAIDAYSRAAELDPQNKPIQQRLQLLQGSGANSASLPPAPAPVDVHPSQYSTAPGGGYAPNGSPGASPRLPQAQVSGVDSRDVTQPGGRDLPAPPADYARAHSPGPFRGGAAPPPLNHVDETRGSMSRHAPLAPMETERPDPREPYRAGGPFNAPPTGRYDPTSEMPPRRHAASPSSPRRRAEATQAGYPNYPPPHPAYRDREREEWERRERTHLTSHDPRQPSPRMAERNHPHADPRTSASRGAVDPREFSRPPEGYPGYGYERGPSAGSYPTPFDGRRDEHRHEEVDRDSKPLLERGNGQLRQHSVARESDMRAPSPAASTSSKASARRKASDKREDEKSKKAKKATEKKDKRLNGEGAASPRQAAASPAPSHSISQSKGPGPSRTVDEDYDEGAADALMFLHADRRPSSSHPATTDKPSPPVSVAGTKRMTPPSPEAHPSSGTKKSRPSPPASASSPTKRTVIEVLNAPKVHSMEHLKSPPGPDKSDSAEPTPAVASKPTSPASAEPEKKSEAVAVAVTSAEPSISAPKSPEALVASTATEKDATPSVETAADKEDVEMRDETSKEPEVST